MECSSRNCQCATTFVDEEPRVVARAKWNDLSIEVCFKDMQRAQRCILLSCAHIWFPLVGFRVCACRVE